MKYLQALLVFLALASAGTALAQSDPSPDQIYQAARAGHLAEAQQMVDQVLRDRPSSGRAHYIAAEIYAREGNLARARQELSTAEQLAPGLPFVTNPRAVQELRSQLAERTTPRGGSAFTVPYSRHPASVPWGLIVLIVGGVAVLWIVVARRRAAAMAYQQYAGGPVAAGAGYGTGQGYGPGYGPGPGYGAPGMGSTLAGGLASGLAVGAGVVAGEELAHRFLDSDRGVGPPVVPEEPVDPNADMGGTDFGVGDSSSWDGGGGGSDSFGSDGGGDWT